MTRKIFSIFLLLLSFGSITSCAQSSGFSIKSVPSKYIREKSAATQLSNDSYIELTKYLPSKYSRKGDVDYTTFIQAAINENEKIIFPDFPLLINDLGLSIPSNRTLLFRTNSLLKMSSSNKERYEVLRIDNVSNVKVIGAKLEGDRKSHRGSTGEWGMGIAIRGNSKNIQILDAVISDCWGDGIYLGHLRNIAPENIQIDDPIINYCRRNGISITTGKNVKVNNALISNIIGTAPQSGIVIEPSNSKAIFHDITVSRPTIYNVGETGVKIAGFELLLGNPDAVSSITIDRPILDGSKYNFFIGRIRDVNTVKGSSIGGQIKIVNPVMLNANTNSFIIRKQSKRGPKINVTGLSPNIINAGKNEAKEVQL